MPFDGENELGNAECVQNNNLIVAKYRITKYFFQAVLRLFLLNKPHLLNFPDTLYEIFHVCSRSRVSCSLLRFFCVRVRNKANLFVQFDVCLSVHRSISVEKKTN